jgi:hypothetical protein
MRRDARRLLAKLVEKQKMDMMQPVSSPQPDAHPAFQMIRVLNRNTFAVVDRWDGVPFVFLPNVPLNIPPDAASHFFAWPAEPELRRLHIAKRNGWNTPDDIKRDDAGTMRWEKWVDAIEIAPVLFDIVQRQDEPIPADDEDAPMAETGDLPMPMGDEPDLASTKVGVRRRDAPRRPRRVDV